MNNTSRLNNFITLFISLLICSFHSVQASNIGPDLAIINARLIGDSGDLQSGMSILISSGKIVQVTKQVSSPNAVSVIDANNRIVLPGFIDSHLHLIAHLDVDNNQSLAEQIKTEVVPKLQDYLRHGVTTIKSTADPVDGILELREQLRSGHYAGPRLLVAGKEIAAKDAHPGKTLFENAPWLRDQIVSEVRSPEEARQAVRELAERDVDAIKIIYSGNEEGDDSYRLMNLAIPRLSVNVLKAVVDEAHHHKIRVTAHTVQMEEAIAAANAGVNGLEHGVVMEPVTQQFLDIMLKNKVAYVPTLRVVNYFLNDVPAQVPLDNLRKIAAAGIMVVLGTDSEGNDLPWGDAVLDEAELMVSAGMTPLQVIRAMTVNAAHHLGVDNETGTIAVNKQADIVIVDGEPLNNISDLRNVWLVLKNGQVMFE
ncbi:MAG: imidazolonepropionase-like amidohydrolase [Gammaproteobacteria bacterium]|jgi:imidazolonepropionase-like amidohydrolase